MSSLWKRINSLTSSRRNRKSSTWSSPSGCRSSPDTIFVNSYLLSSSHKHRKSSDQHDVCLRTAPWFQADMSRESAVEQLSGRRIGSFIVRVSSSQPGCFALSVRVPTFNNRSGISHYLITTTTKGTFKIKGLDKEWTSLDSLITHHSVMKEMLPCALRLLNTNHEDDDDDDEHCKRREEDDDDDDEEEDDDISDEDNSQTNFVKLEKIIGTQHRI